MIAFKAKAESVTAHKSYLNQFFIPSYFFLDNSLAFRNDCCQRFSQIAGLPASIALCTEPAWAGPQLAAITASTSWEDIADASSFSTRTRKVRYRGLRPLCINICNCGDLTARQFSADSIDMLHNDSACADNANS
jgi:hypothetical protein